MPRRRFPSSTYALCSEKGPLESHRTRFGGLFGSRYRDTQRKPPIPPDSLRGMVRFTLRSAVLTIPRSESGGIQCDLRLG
ncbi:MAG: hypothetical protein GW893_13360 [Armatimonadetes bacterium]|nr:hypothetical protein [Armatimonadota bacterium]